MEDAVGISNPAFSSARPSSGLCGAARRPIAPGFSTRWLPSATSVIHATQASRPPRLPSHSAPMDEIAPAGGHRHRCSRSAACEGCQGSRLRARRCEALRRSATVRARWLRVDPCRQTRRERPGRTVRPRSPRRRPRASPQATARSDPREPPQSSASATSAARQCRASPMLTRCGSAGRRAVPLRRRSGASARPCARPRASASPNRSVPRAKP